MELTIENYTKLKTQNLKRSVIASNLGISESQLKKYITKNNLGARKPKVSNPRAFSTYTLESCYWGGFLAADGCVDDKGRVRLMLKFDDINHLKKFKSFVGSTHKVCSNTTTYNRCSFEFTSKVMCEDLYSMFKLTPRKTKTLEFPPNIPKRYMKDFIRGYFDGDGSLCESFSNKNSRTTSIYASFCSGSIDFMTYLVTYLGSELGVTYHVQSFPNKQAVKFNTNQAKILCEWMYEDATVYLDRKYILYNKLIVNNERTTR